MFSQQAAHWRLRGMEASPSGHEAPFVEHAYFNRTFFLEALGWRE